MLVPTTKSGTMPTESSTWMTPTCAMPRTPPPGSTSAVGPAAAHDGAAAWARRGDARSSAALAATARRRAGRDLTSRKLFLRHPFSTIASGVGQRLAPGNAERSDAFLGLVRPCFQGHQ